MSAQLQAQCLRVLPLHPSHLPQVLAIERDAYEFPWSEGIFNDCIKSGYSSWVVLDEAEAVRGYAFMSMAVGEAHVLNLCVASLTRQCGYGRQLLDHLVTIARAAHCTQVLLEVRKSNKAALILYERSGFVRIGLRKGYYPAMSGREDAVVLSLELV